MDDTRTIPEALRIPDFSRALNVSDATVRRYLLSGQLKGFRLPSGVWRIPLTELERITHLGSR